MEEEDWSLFIAWDNEDSHDHTDSENETTGDPQQLSQSTNQNNPTNMEIVNSPNESSETLMEDIVEPDKFSPDHMDNIVESSQNKIPEEETSDSEINNEIHQFTPRSYQKELYQKACQQNIIACVETGSGKTLVAALLIQKVLRNIGNVTLENDSPAEPLVNAERLPNTLRNNEPEVIDLDSDEPVNQQVLQDSEPSDERQDPTDIEDSNLTLSGSDVSSVKRKFVVFLVPRVPLLNQQSGFLRKVLPTEHTVGSYNGEKGMDDWSSSRWAQSLATKSVLVMTAQIFLNLLQHGLVSLDEVVLLILDEAHHATKNHPYRRIFQEFYHELGPKMHRPRVFGMTATPVKKKTEAVNETLCTDSIATLEKTLDAVFITVSKDKQSEVSAHLAAPDEFVARYSRGFINQAPLDMDIDSNSVGMEPTATTVSAILRNKSVNQYFNESELSALQRIREQLGLLGAIFYAEHLLRDKPEDIDHMRELLIEQSTQGELENGGVSHKVSVLLDVIFAEFKREEVVCVDSGTSHIPQHAFKCIVFVQERITAFTLAWLIESSFQNLGRDELRTKAVVGAGKSAFGNHLTTSKFDEIISEFRNGQFGILVATNVIEEGIDIPDCGVVISFDGLISPTVYVQVKGRARTKNGRFIVLLANDEDDSAKAFMQARYGAAVMASVAKGYNAEFPNGNKKKKRTVFSNEGEKKLHSLTTRARIGATEARGLLNRYCNMRYFGTDGKSLSPIYTTMENELGFIATVKLPSGCRVEFGYCTDPQRSAVLAIREAALDAYRNLYRIGEVDAHLLPKKPLKSKKRALRTISNKQIVNNAKRWKYVRNRPVVPKKMKKASRMRSCRIAPACVPSTLNENTAPSKEVMKTTEVEPSQHNNKKPKQATASISPPVKEQLVLVHLFKVNVNASQGNMMWYDQSKDKSFGIITYSDVPNEDLNAIQCPSGSALLSLERIGEISWDKTVQKKAYTYSRYVQLCLLGRVPGSLRAKEYEENFAKANDPSFLLLPLEKSKNGDTLEINWVEIDNLLSFGWFYGPLQQNQLAQEDNVQHKILCSYHDKGDRVYLTGAIHQSLTASSPPGDLLTKHYSSFVQYFEQRHRTLIWNHNQRVIFSYHTREIMTGGKGSPFGLVPEICRVIPIDPKACFITSILPKWQKYLALRQCWRNLSAMEDCVPFLAIAQALQPNVSEVASKNSALSYERVECLGDSVLKIIHTLVKFIKNPNDSEGTLTDDRSVDVSNKRLADFALEMKVQDGVSLASVSQSPKVWPWFWGTNQSRPVNISEKVLADCVEAILGTHYVHAGFSTAVLFVDKFGLIPDAAKFLGISQKGSNLEWRGVEVKAPELPDWDKRMESANISCVEEAIGYKFKDRRHLVVALTHGSYSQSYGYSYQRYEYCGDAVIEFLLLSYFFKTYPELDQGDLSAMCCTMLSNELFARISISHNIHTHMWRSSKALDENIAKYVELDKMLENDDDTVTTEMATPKILGDLFEAVIGAIVADKGMKLDGVLEIILTVMKTELERWGNPEKLAEDPVTQLMKLTHTRYQQLPQIFFEDEPDDVEKCCVIKVQGDTCGTGKGSTRRLAKRNAAINAVKTLDKNTA